MARFLWDHCSSSSSDISKKTQSPGARWILSSQRWIHTTNYTCNQQTSFSYIVFVNHFHNIVSAAQLSGKLGFTEAGDSPQIIPLKCVRNGARIQAWVPDPKKSLTSCPIWINRVCVCIIQLSYAVQVIPFVFTVKKVAVSFTGRDSFCSKYILLLACFTMLSDNAPTANIASLPFLPVYRHKWRHKDTWILQSLNI